MLDKLMLLPLALYLAPYLVWLFFRDIFFLIILPFTMEVGQSFVPNLQVVEAKEIGKGDSAFNHPDHDSWISEEEASDPAFMYFKTKHNLCWIINATDPNPEVGALSAGCGPSGARSRRPWIYKVFFRGQEVGKYRAFTDRSANCSISQLKVSADGKHYSYVVKANYCKSNLYESMHYFTVLDGKKGPLVDAISATQLSDDGSCLMFIAKKGDSLIEYTLANRFTSKAAVDKAKATKKLRGSLDAQYALKMMRTIGHKWNSPSSTGEGESVVEFVLQNDGEITGLQLSPKSGIPAIDNEGLRAVKRSAPFPPFPPGAPESVWLKVCVKSRGYRIIEMT